MLTRHIPKEILMLIKLTLLNLNCNKLKEGISNGIADLPSLQILYIQNNSLSRIIPEKLGKNSRLVEFGAFTN